MTTTMLRTKALTRATSLFFAFCACWGAPVHATEVETTLIALEGQDLPGAEGEPVAGLKSPFVNEFGDLFLNGDLLSAGVEYGLVWKEPDQILFHGSSVPGGVVMSGIGAASNADDWLTTTWNGSTHELRSGFGVVVEDGDIVEGAASYQIETMYEPVMTADATGFFRVYLHNLDAGGAGWAVMRVEDGGAAEPEFEIDLQDLIDGYPLVGPNGVTGYNVSPDGVHEVLTADLRIDGVKRNSLVINREVVAMKNDPTGRPNEKWRTFERPAVGPDGSYAGAAIVKSGSSFYDVLAYSPNDASPLGGGLGEDRSPRVLLGENDCVGTAGWSTPCVTLQADGDLKTVAFDRPDPDGARALAYVWFNPMSGPEAGDEYLVYVCDAADPTASHVLLSRGDPLDLDGDGSDEAVVERVGLSGYPEIAFGESQLYIGAELTIAGQDLEAVLGLARPDCGGLGGGR